LRKFVPKPYLNYWKIYLWLTRPKPYQTGRQSHNLLGHQKNWPPGA